MNRILYIILCMQWFRNFEVYHEHISLGKGSHLCAMNCLWRLLLYSHLAGGSRWCGVGQVVLQRGHAPSDTKVSISWSNLHGIACSVLFFSAMHQCRGSIYDHEYNTLNIGHEFITQNVVSKMAVVHLYYWHYRKLLWQAMNKTNLQNQVDWCWHPSAQL